MSSLTEGIRQQLQDLRDYEAAGKVADQVKAVLLAALPNRPLPIHRTERELIRAAGLRLLNAQISQLNVFVERGAGSTRYATGRARIARLRAEFARVVREVRAANTPLRWPSAQEAACTPSRPG